MVKRGPEAGREAVAKLETLISEAEARSDTLPLNGKALHLGKICEALGVGRATVHQNPAFEARLRAYAETKGVAFSVKEIAPDPERQTETLERPAPGPDTVPAAKLRAAERRIATLEKRVSELTARNADLASDLRQARHTEDHLLSRGRRLHPSENAPMANILENPDSGDLS